MTTPLQVADTGTGSASASVVYLEVMRSSDVTDLPVIEVSDSEHWVSLVAYPDFSAADQLRVTVERASGSEPDSDTWEVVLEDTIGTGLQDTVVVNVRTELLVPAVHRLRIESMQEGVATNTLTSMFRVSQQGT